MIVYLQYHGERNKSLSERDEESSIEDKYKHEYLNKLEAAISEGSMIKKAFHPISMKYKDSNLEAKVCSFNVYSSAGVLLFLDRDLQTVGVGRGGFRGLCRTPNSSCIHAKNIKFPK